jgi:hypothetical protein
MQLGRLLTAGGFFSFYIHTEIVCDPAKNLSALFRQHRRNIVFFHIDISLVLMFRLHASCYPLVALGV